MNDWRHLERLTDARGLFEHANGTLPSHHHGYCSDDNGRALVVVCRSQRTDSGARALAERYLAFCTAAYAGGGQFRLRMAHDGRWRDGVVSDDASGRAIWGLGVAAAVAPWPEVSVGAARLFEDACAFRTPWPRAAAYAALGAVAFLRVRPHHGAANELLDELRSVLAHHDVDTRETNRWRWPESRLHYANALLPHAEIEIGRHRDNPRLVDAALTRLRWLLAAETRNDHLSFVPTSGWAAGEPRPAFDQQPIEAWHLAEAAWAALEATGDLRWQATIEQCNAWFHGANDAGVVMFDPDSGGGYDGLRNHGVNENQGAESTLAWLAVRQIAELVRATGAAY
jgi:hypothetical protein